MSNRALNLRLGLDLCNSLSSFVPKFIIRRLYEYGYIRLFDVVLIDSEPDSTLRDERALEGEVTLSAAKPSHLRIGPFQACVVSSPVGASRIVGWVDVNYGLDGGPCFVVGQNVLTGNPQTMKGTGATAPLRKTVLEGAHSS